MELLEWTITYGNGMTYSSKDGSPKKAPKYNVQVIVEGDDLVGVRSWRGDFYIFTKSGKWVAVSEFGVLDWILNDLDSIEVVLSGRYIPTPEFRKINQLALGNPDLPKKTGREKDEP